MSKYLYNGIELPALPEWDKETYPYAHIYLANPPVDGSYYLYATAAPPSYAYVSEYSGDLMKYADGTPCLVWKLPTGQSEWVEPYTYTQYAASSYAVPHWANYDILYEDGTLCLAASDPEPVTTAPIPADLYIKENGKVYKVDMYRVYKKEQ